MRPLWRWAYKDMVGRKKELAWQKRMEEKRMAFMHRAEQQFTASQRRLQRVNPEQLPPVPALAPAEKARAPAAGLLGPVQGSKKASAPAPALAPAGTGTGYNSVSPEQQREAPPAPRASSPRNRYQTCDRYQT